MSKAELSTENETKRPPHGSFGVVFGVQLDSLEKKRYGWRGKSVRESCLKSVSAIVEKV